jgi:hypothetical protein
MTLSLRYGDLSGTISEANKLAKELDQYCDDLSKKVQQKLYSVEGGLSSALNSADYYVRNKISQLRTKEKNAYTLSTKTQNLLDTAKRVDNDVKSTIEANQKNFFKKHAELKAPWYKRAFVSFVCDAKNVPILGTLIKGGEVVLGAMDVLKNDIRYWYKCGGGKELVGIVLSVVGAVLAVVVLVCAVVFTGGSILAVIAGVAGVIGAIIGLVNSVTNIVTSFQAYNEANGGHPGKAKIYAGQDKLSDVLRQTNFHNKDWNRGSNAWASGIEITDTVCSIITVVNGAVETVGALRKINLSQTFRAICQPRNALGQWQGKPSLWTGVKSIALKFNIKDFALGDLNVKNLSRITKIPRVDKFKAIAELAKASKGIVDNLDKVNEGKITIGEFIAKRVVVGLDTTFLKQQVLTTKIGEDGGRVRKFGNTNFSTIIKAVRVPVDGLGIGKLLTDLGHSETLSNVLNMKGGIIENVTDIVKQINMWSPSQLSVDIPTIAPISVKGITGIVSKRPLVEFSCALSKPAFTLPNINISIKLENIRPYYNVQAA